jgi:hypothetical protein
MPTSSAIPATAEAQSRMTMASGVRSNADIVILSEINSLDRGTSR